jgi:tetratricopeptide (TPR) repeat protein
VSRYRAIAEESEEAIQVGREALEMAEALGLDEIRAHALNNIGLARLMLGDREGLADLERSIEIALAAKSPEAARGYNNLASMIWFLGDVRRSHELFDEAVRVGEELGSGTVGRYSRIVRIQFRFIEGEWSEGFREADAFIAACEEGDPHYLESSVRSERASARLARGDVDGALDDISKAIDHARGAKDPQALTPTLSRAARLLADVGQMEEAVRVADEVLAYHAGYVAGELAWVARTLNRVQEVTRMLDEQRLETRWNDAARAVLDQKFDEAADIFYEIGELDDEAEARLRAAEWFVQEGRRAEADVQLQKALAFYRSVGATRYIREAESLLAESA